VTGIAGVKKCFGDDWFLTGLAAGEETGPYNILGQPECCLNPPDPPFCCGPAPTNLWAWFTDGDGCPCLVDEFIPLHRNPETGYYQGCGQVCGGKYLCVTFACEGGAATDARVIQTTFEGHGILTNLEPDSSNCTPKEWVFSVLWPDQGADCDGPSFLHVTENHPMPMMSAARTQRSATGFLTIPGLSTLFVEPVAVLRDEGGLTVGTGGFKIPAGQGGLYQIWACLTGGNTVIANPSRIFIALYKNGVEWEASPFTTAGFQSTEATAIISNEVSVSFALTALLAAGDEVRLIVGTPSANPHAVTICNWGIDGLGLFKKFP